MGKCKKCGTDIDDGIELCENCSKKVTNDSIQNIDKNKIGSLEDEIDFDFDNLDIDISDFDEINLDNTDLGDLSLMNENEEEIFLDTPSQLETIDNMNETNQDILGDIPMDDDIGKEEEFDLSSFLTENNDLGESSEAVTDDIVNNMEDDIENIAEDNLDLLQSQPTVAEDDLSDISSLEEQVEESTGTEEVVLGTDKKEEVPEELGLDDVLGGFDDLGYLFSEEEKMEAAKNAERIDEDILELAPDIQEDSEDRTGKGIFSRLFGNVKDSKWEKEKERQEKEAEQERLKAEEEEKLKEEKVAEAENKKKEKEEQKAAKEAAKKQAKEEKARLKKEKKEQKEQNQEIEEDTGRINRVGATIVFALFAILAVFIVFGTNTFSYNQSIERANNYFTLQKYNEAYDEIKGINVKEKDEEIYQKVMTVMYVNKELNSYNNYYNAKLYTQSLDSLLKGLERYDKYLYTAKELEIKEDLDYVKSNILKELKDTFSLSETKAKKLIEITDSSEYTDKIEKVVSSN